MASKFDVQIDKAFAKVDKYLDNFMNEFVKDFAEELITRTPVYPVEGGFLQSNWRFAANFKPQGKLTPKERSEVADSFQQSMSSALSINAKYSDTVWITNTTDYAKTNEYGLSFYPARNFTGSTVAIADKIAAKTKARLKNELR